MLKIGVQNRDWGFRGRLSKVREYVTPNCSMILSRSISSRGDLQLVYMEFFV